MLFRRAGGLGENSSSCSEVRLVVAELAHSRRLGALSAAGGGCAEGSWLTSFQLEEKAFLEALGSIISTSSLLHGENQQQSLADSRFHLPPFPAVTSFLNQKRTLFPERALFAASTCRSPRSWCSLWCPWQAGQEEGTEFLGGRVEGLLLHPVPAFDVGLWVHCPILGGGRDISSVSCDRAEFC